MYPDANGTYRASWWARFWFGFGARLFGRPTVKCKYAGKEGYEHDTLIEGYSWRGGFYVTRYREFK